MMRFSRICALKRIATISYLTLILSSSCNTVPQTPTPDPLYPYPYRIISANGLAFNIILDKTTYQLGQPISVTMTLMNTGYEAGWVNKRLVLVYDAVEGETITFVIKDATGEEMPFVTRLDFRPSQFPGDFVILRPHEFVGDTFEISRHYLFRPGSYSVQVIYENTLDLDNSEIAWKGRLESEMVTFTIEPQE